MNHLQLYAGSSFIKVQMQTISAELMIVYVSTTLAAAFLLIYNFFILKYIKFGFLMHVTSDKGILYSRQNSVNNCNVCSAVMVKQYLTLLVGICVGVCGGVWMCNSNFLKNKSTQKSKALGKEITVFSEEVCVYFMIQKIKHHIYSREVYIWALSF